MARSIESDRPGSLPSLYAITPQWSLDRLVPELRNLITSSNTIVQVRDKALTDETRMKRAQAIVEICQETDTICIINDRADIAAEAGASGVHIGAADGSVAQARSYIEDGLVGVTCRSAADARQAESEGADYLGVGPVYPTISKADLPDPIGVQKLAEIAGSVELPVFAIGGMTPERSAEIIGVGIHGVAAISALFTGEVPAAARAALFEQAMGVSDETLGSPEWTS